MEAPKIDLRNNPTLLKIEQKVWSFPISFMLWSMERGIPGKTDMQSKRQQTRKSVSQHNTVFENDTKMSHFNFVSKYLKLYILNVCIFAPKKAFTHCGKFQFLVHLLNLDQCNSLKMRLLQIIFIQYAIWMWNRLKNMEKMLSSSLVSYQIS